MGRITNPITRRVCIFFKMFGKHLNFSLDDDFSAIDDKFKSYFSDFKVRSQSTKILRSASEPLKDDL